MIRNKEHFNGNQITGRIFLDLDYLKICRNKDLVKGKELNCILNIQARDVMLEFKNIELVEQWK